MVSLDIDYAENRSFLGDLAILARTPKAVLGRKGVA
jgi:lipopolysaccharide/colanic/teichoic acid biosynthesis glycosyltransferase